MNSTADTSYSADHEPCRNTRHDHDHATYEVCGAPFTACTGDDGCDPDGYELAPPCDGNGTIDLGAGGTGACDGCRDCARLAP